MSHSPGQDPDTFLRDPGENLPRAGIDRHPILARGKVEAEPAIGAGGDPGHRMTIRGGQDQEGRRAGDLVRSLVAGPDPRVGRTDDRDPFES